MKKKYIVGIVVLVILFLMIADADKKAKNETSNDTSTEEVVVEEENTTSKEDGVEDVEVETPKKEVVVEDKTTETVNYEWVEYAKNPVIEFGDTMKNFMWGDPSVIKENGVYKMWMGAEDITKNPLEVKAYYATSDDGIDWDIRKEPVLRPTPGAWDSHGIEVPSVIKVGSTYHMYYTGYDQDFSAAVYSIGHATSKDGINWTKDPNNPLIVPNEDPLKWGFFTTAEPAVVHHNGTFYLYYTSAKSNYPAEGAPFGILLATSKDGSTFTDGQIVHTLSSAYDPKVYRGYSTPAVYVDNGNFHLYYDIVRDPDGFEQVGISSAISTNGYDFTENGVDIFTTGEGDWKDYSIIGPSVLLDGDEVKIWFGGHAAEYGKRKFNAGIGYATKQLK